VSKLPSFILQLTQVADERLKCAATSHTCERLIEVTSKGFPLKHFVLLAAAMLFVAACGPAQIFMRGGHKQLRSELHPAVPATRVLVFAMDGAGYEQFLRAVSSGKAKNIMTLMGRRESAEIYEHAYSIANAMSVLPTTMPAWVSIFTGQPPAYTGVTGDEFFIREQNRFYAPVPVSINTHEDTYRVLSNDLLGKLIQTPTLYELVKVRSYVSLNGVYRGADVFTDLDRATYTSIAADLLKSEVLGTEPSDQVVARIDEDATTAVIKNLEQDGLPDLQVVYFPGIDVFTHHTPDPLNSQELYLERVTDYSVGRILDYYRWAGVLDRTYVLFIADHGHTPTLPDADHALGSEEGADLLPRLLRHEGFRPRPFALTPAPGEQDYQAVVAYQGVVAYIYLADRSRCQEKKKQCSWGKPPRFKEDVMPVVRALYRSGQYGNPIPQLKGKLDLIFAREPVAPGQNAHPFDIFDGKNLLPISTYMARHPRLDLIELDLRMKWLGAGPHGDRAGDIVVLPHFSSQDPIERRYYFGPRYYSEHGSPSLQDGHIPFVLARTTLSGKQLRAIAKPTIDQEPTQLDVASLIRRLLRPDSAALEAAAR
jgi:hypothetical protein